MSDTTEMRVKVNAGQQFIASELANDELVDAIWQDLAGLVSRDRIRQVACEVAATYQDATITSFVPIFIRRRTKEILARQKK